MQSVIVLFIMMMARMQSHGPTRLIMMRQKPFLIVEPDTIIRRMEFRGYTHMYRGHHKDQEHGLRIFAQDLPIS